MDISRQNNPTPQSMALSALMVEFEWVIYVVTNWSAAAMLFIYE